MEAGSEKRIYTPHDRNDGVWIEHDDSLYVAAYSSVASLTVSFAGYFRKANGEILRYEIDVAPTSDRAVTATQQVFGAGFLLSCAAYLKSGNANRGQCYVRAGIRKGSGTPLVVLNQIVGGYVTDDFSPSFPFGKIEGPLEGPGYLRDVTGTTPAVASDIDEVVPAGARWRLHDFFFIFTADANVANRLVQWVVLRTNLSRSTYGTNVATTAGLSQHYSVRPGGTTGTVGTNRQSIAIGDDLILGAADEIVTVTNNIQAGDQISSVLYRVEEWLEA